jgi:DNA-directed RNA polymerase alpha subunit
VLITQRPTLSEEPISDTRSRFTIEPLEPGFGYTLGNSLRRTLLSSIPGAAVTSIKIDGVLHEFTTIPGVKEDVVELVMNVKELCVSSEHDEPVSMYLRKQGPGDITAGDIQPPAGVTVHNPDLKLATLNGKARVDMELAVERGRGYVTATFDPAGVVDSFADTDYARANDLHARRLCASKLYDEEVLKKLFAEIVPRYAGRAGGFTRTVKLMPRRGDGAPMAQIELIP